MIAQGRWWFVRSAASLLGFFGPSVDEHVSGAVTYNQASRAGGAGRCPRKETLQLAI